MDKQKVFRPYRLIVTFILAFVLLPVTGAFAQMTYSISDTSTMTLFGTSNVHDWECDVTTINGSVKMDDTKLSDVRVTIPVKSIESGKGGMNSNMYKALKADKHENITFSLQTVEMKEGEGTNQVQLLATGELTIAGKTNTIEMSVNSDKTDSGYTFVGEKTINMTDYGVKPPTAMFGTISTGEEVTIKFTIHTEATATN